MGGPHQEPAERTCTAGSTGRARRSRTARSDDSAPWAHPNSRFTTTLANVPNIAPDYDAPVGVPIDAIIFGGRTRDREPLIRAITDLAEGVYDGLTLGAEATVGRRGQGGRAPLRPDVQPALHGLRRGRLRAATTSTSSGRPPTSRSSRTSTGSSATPRTATSCGPATATTCARCCGCSSSSNGEVEGRQTAVGIIPTEEELDLEGVDIPRRGPRADPDHRQGALAAGDGLPRGAPRAVRPDARGDLGGPPPGRRGRWRTTEPERHARRTRHYGGPGATGRCLGDRRAAGPTTVLDLQAAVRPPSPAALMRPFGFVAGSACSPCCCRPTTCPGGCRPRGRRLLWPSWLFSSSQPSSRSAPGSTRRRPTSRSSSPPW